MTDSAFSLDIPSAPFAFDVLSFSGIEAISQPYAFDVDVACHDDSLDIRDLMYAAVFLSFKNGKGGFHGQVHGVMRRDFLPGPACYRLTFGPRLACLGQRHNPRVFQDLTALEIIRRVLLEHGIRDNSYSFELKTDCQPRAYCAQYRETDLQFIQRLCAEEGIHYHFRHSRQGHELVFGDGLRSFRRAPEAPFLSTANQPGVQRFAVSHEEPDTPGSRLQQAAEGESTLSFLSAGQLLPLIGHPQAEWNHLWLVTEVRHRGGYANGPMYTNQWKAAPWEVGFRPPYLPQGERLLDVQRARIIGPTPDQAHLDAEGRVQVQFDWGRQGEGARFTECWLPVTERLQGCDAEGRARLRVGMQVLVSFLQGNPDRPLVTGCLLMEWSAALPVAALPAPSEEQRCIEAWLDPRTLIGEERLLQVVGGPSISFEEGCQLLFRVGDSTLGLDGQSLKLSANRLTLSLDK